MPHAARWPYEVHLYPRRRVPTCPRLTARPARSSASSTATCCAGSTGSSISPAPVHLRLAQAPVRREAATFALHLELFTIRRAPGKLKYLAGSESGMGAFANDVAPEAAAGRLRELG